MIHLRKNYSGQDPKCADGDEFYDCNLSQVEPETVVCNRKQRLRFIACNLANCRVPTDAFVESCLVVQADLNKTVEKIEVDGVSHDVRRNVVVGRGVK